MTSGPVPDSTGWACHAACMETDPRDQPEEDDKSRDTPPPVPDEDDESPLGDTDQHSDADA